MTTREDALNAIETFIKVLLDCADEDWVQDAEVAANAIRKHLKVVADPHPRAGLVDVQKVLQAVNDLYEHFNYVDVQPRDIIEAIESLTQPQDKEPVKE